MSPEHLQVLDKEKDVNSGPQNQTLERGIFVFSHVTQGQVTMKRRADERHKTGDNVNDKNKGTKNG